LFSKSYELLFSQALYIQRRLRCPLLSPGAFPTARIGSPDQGVGKMRKVFTFSGLPPL
jgi:hypothetical protein